VRVTIPAAWRDLSFFFFLQQRTTMYYCERWGCVCSTMLMVRYPDDKRRVASLHQGAFLILHPRVRLIHRSCNARSIHVRGRKITCAGADIQLKSRKWPETRSDRSQMFNHSLEPHRYWKASKHQINWLIYAEEIHPDFAFVKQRIHLNAHLWDEVFT